MTKFRILSYVLASILVLSCDSVTHKRDVSDPDLAERHILNQDKGNKSEIPKIVRSSPVLPKPSPQTKEETHTVVVSNVPVSELLFSLARDADLNLDIDSDVSQNVTLNAVNQPLNAILERIVESSNLTYEIKNNVLRIKVDRPFIKYYRIDYINMSRLSESTSSVSTQISSTGQGAEGDSGGSADNNSTTDVRNESSNTFWETLASNISAIISPDEITIQAAPSGESSEVSAQTIDSSNNNLIINKETGIVAVRATRKQHKDVDKFINEVLFSSRRQVLIEATIAEITLNDRFQAGIDWSLIGNALDNSIINATQSFTDVPLFSRPSFNLSVTEFSSNGDTIQTTLSALEQFGDVSIMSSPKVMTLNNQTALLKVVDNIVYFSVDVNIETSSDEDGGSNGFVTFETEANTVPVGFVMSVTPFISEENAVTLNMRPTISRVIGQAVDPNPSLAEVGVVSEIPIIQVREVESMLKINSGEIAVMGGLMQDKIAYNRRGVPVLSRLPFLGSLFRYEDNSNEKTELVIFIKPTVIEQRFSQPDLLSYKSLQLQ